MAVRLMLACPHCGYPQIVDATEVPHETPCKGCGMALSVPDVDWGDYMQKRQPEGSK